MATRQWVSPTDAGRRWAEERADILSGDVPAIDWPDTWEYRSDHDLELPEEADANDAQAYRDAAHHAACERWAELLAEHRGEESVNEEETDAEAEAVKLVEKIRDDLPEGLEAAHDGPRVYLLDSDGFEMTVTSLEDTWRVVSEWEQRHTTG